MTVFWATAELKPGNVPGVSLGTDHNRARFADFVRKNIGVRLKIEPLTPESDKQRKFFEGALVPFIAFYQENLSWQDTDDLKVVREWLKIEFNGKFITMGGRSVKVAKSTKGALNRGFLERVLDWAGEQGYQVELLSTEEYKRWRDTVFPHGGPKTYIGYLLETARLIRPGGGGDKSLVADAI